MIEQRLKTSLDKFWQDEDKTEVRGYSDNKHLYPIVNE
jgi:hypothetical protein